MSVRVVARIRPLLEKELDQDVIVRADRGNDSKSSSVVKIPNPKNESEEFSFTFNSVYDQLTTQEELFTAEVAPHVKSLFLGLDVTIFAYGVTGTGKTHTMRGGLKLAERGVIPRLLSNVFRRGKKIAKDSNGGTTVGVALSYYEIYNDRVFDLLEPPEKRTPAGLPLREKDSKTFVVGLSERACEDLRDFERLYIEANNNRVTAATKLNAHSSRSHAILRVKLTQTTGDRVRESTASAIDLAGSEDNRRTDNGKERLVESAAINKSLFVLSQCIDAISRGDKRIPYRESKMTRILSLGQNNGITIMILNLSPLRSYHLDTLSSLNVSSRAKRIEVREIENEVVFKQPPRSTTSVSGTTMRRQPLRPLANAHNIGAAAGSAAAKSSADKPEKPDKPIKAFSVYTDRAKPPAVITVTATMSSTGTAMTSSRPHRRSNHQKRPSDLSEALSGRPTKIPRSSLTTCAPQPVTISAEQIEAMVERKVSEILASRAAEMPPPQIVAPASPAATAPPSDDGHLPAAAISDEVQRRLEALERRIENEEERRRDDGLGKEERSEGLLLLLQARQAKARGDDAGTLALYERALVFFPAQAKLLAKIERLRAKLGGAESSEASGVRRQQQHHSGSEGRHTPRRRSGGGGVSDEQTEEQTEEADDESPAGKKLETAKSRHKMIPRSPLAKKRSAVVRATSGTDVDDADDADDDEASPRTKKLLDIVNSRDLARIKRLNGFGAKKAQDLIDHLAQEANEESSGRLRSLAQLRQVPGMGSRTVERAYEGLLAVGVDV